MTTLALGQTHEIDTVIDRKHYTYISYYDNGKIMSLGNYKDTLKTGDWIYFTRKTEKLAFGKYQNDSKYGDWTYFNNNKIYKIKWSEKQKPGEKFEFDKKGNLIIIDIVYAAPCFHYYRNGMATMTARAL